MSTLNSPRPHLASPEVASPQPSKTNPIQRLGLVLLVTIAMVILWGMAQVSLVPSPASGLLGLVSLNRLAQVAVPYEVAIANGKPSLVEFYAHWCTTCQAMAPSLERLHHDYGDRVNFVMIDIDDPQGRQPMHRYGVTGVPHLTGLTADQQVIKTAVGELPPAALKDLLDQLKA